MRVVTALSDRIVVLDQGRVLAQGKRGGGHGARRRRRLPTSASRMLERARRCASTTARRPRCRGRVARDRATGELVCVVGPNGAGKTTLINAIAGLHRIARGTLVMDGRDLTRVAAHRFCARGHRASCPRAGGCSRGMTVRENLEIGSYLPAARRTRKRARSSTSARCFRRCATSSDVAAGSLSGGQQQMVAIGRALMAKPRLLLLDEPSLGLSPVMVRRCSARSARSMRRAPRCCWSSRTSTMALELADRAYLLEEGRIVAEGAPGDDLRRSRAAARLPRYRGRVLKRGSAALPRPSGQGTPGGNARASAAKSCSTASASSSTSWSFTRTRPGVAGDGSIDSCFVPDPSIERRSSASFWLAASMDLARLPERPCGDAPLGDVDRRPPRWRPSRNVRLCARNSRTARPCSSTATNGPRYRLSSTDSWTIWPLCANASCPCKGRRPRYRRCSFKSAVSRFPGLHVAPRQFRMRYVEQGACQGARGHASNWRVFRHRLRGH